MDKPGSEMTLSIKAMKVVKMYTVPRGARRGCLERGRCWDRVLLEASCEVCAGGWTLSQGQTRVTEALTKKWGLIKFLFSKKKVFALKNYSG